MPVGTHTSRAVVAANLVFAVCSLYGWCMVAAPPCMPPCDSGGVDRQTFCFDGLMQQGWLQSWLRRTIIPTYAPWCLLCEVSRLCLLLWYTYAVMCVIQQ